MGYSLPQLKALSALPRVSGVLSFLGSSWIITEILFDAKKLKNTCHQLLLAMSVYDVLESVWNVASTAPIPEGTEGIYGAAGTANTCVAQGFFLQFGVAIPVYNACLSIYYLLVIAHDYTEKRLRRHVTPVMHVVAFLVAITTATAAIPLKLYNNASLWCWLAALPQGCDEGEDIECIRGDNAWIYQIAFWYIPVLGSMFVSLVCNVLVYLSVRKREVASALWNPKHRFSITAPTILANTDESGGNDTLENSSFFGRSWLALSLKIKGGSTTDGTAKEKQQINPRSREVFEQSFWFTLAFWVTHFLCSAKLTRRDSFPFWVVALIAIFDPLQGFLNFLVYRRPRYVNHLKKIRKRNAPSCCPPRLQALLLTMRWSFLGDPVSKRRSYELNQQWSSRMGCGSPTPLSGEVRLKDPEHVTTEAKSLDAIFEQTQDVHKHQESSQIDTKRDDNDSAGNPRRTSSTTVDEEHFCSVSNDIQEDYP